MPLPRPPAPYKTFLGWSLGSEEAADLERVKIRRRRALEDGDWLHFLREPLEVSVPNLPSEPSIRRVPTQMSEPEGQRVPENGSVAKPVESAMKGERAEAPESAVKLLAWLRAKGFAVRLKGGQLFAGPAATMSASVRGAISREREGLKLLLIDLDLAKKEAP